MKRMIVVTLLFALIITGCSQSRPEPETEEAATTSEDNALASHDIPDAQPVPEKSKNPVDAEITESGYSLSDGYLFYSVKMHNPNTEYAIYLPSYRVTAKDENGTIIGTMEHTLSIIYPEQDFFYAFQGFECEANPATISFEIIPGQDYNFMKPSLLDHQEYIPLEVIGVNLKDGTFGKEALGEVKNNNDYDIDSVVVSILFRDDDGNLVGGTSTFVNHVPANGTTAFDLPIYSNFVSDDYQVYANIWT